jgi:hypothetical protein
MPGLDATITGQGTLSPKANLELDPTQTQDLLKSMQQMIEQRESPLSQLMSGLKDARAAAVPNLEGAGTQAMDLRDKQKLAEAQDLFKMKQEMTAYQAALAQQQGTQAALNQQITGGQPTAGGQSTAGAGEAIPQSVINSYNLEQTTAGKKAILQDYYKKQGEKNLEFENRAESYSQDVFVYDMDNNGALTKVPVIDAKNNPQRYKRQLPTVNASGSTYKPATNGQTSANYGGPNAAAPQGSSLFNEAANNLIDRREGGYKDTDGNTGAPVNMGINGKFHPGVDVKNMTRDQALGIYKKEYWDEINADALSPASAKVAFDAAVNQGPAYAKRLIAQAGDDADKMLQIRAADYAKGTQNPNWKNRLQNLSEEIKTTSPWKASANVNAPPAPTGNRAVDEQNMATWQAQQKQNLETKGTEQKKSAEKAGERQAAMKENADRAEEMKLNADIIMGLASDPKLQKISGISKQGVLSDPRAAAANILHDVTLGHVSEKTADDMLAKTLSREEIDARDKLERASSALGVQYAAQIFHGARMGIGLENMAMKTKGVGTEYLPETNRMNADIIKEGAIFNQARNELWKQYKETHGGDNASFAAFEDEPAYRKLEDQTRANLAKKYPQIFKVEDDHRVDAKRIETPAAATPPTVTTKQQYDALPSGTVYLEDGKKFRKP